MKRVTPAKGGGVRGRGRTKAVSALQPIKLLQRTNAGTETATQGLASETIHHTVPAAIAGTGRVLLRIAHEDRRCYSSSSSVHSGTRALGRASRVAQAPIVGFGRRPRHQALRKALLLLHAQPQPHVSMTRPLLQPLRALCRPPFRQGIPRCSSTLSIAALLQKPAPAASAQHAPATDDAPDSERIRTDGTKTETSSFRSHRGRLVLAHQCKLCSPLSKPAGQFLPCPSTAKVHAVLTQ